MPRIHPELSATGDADLVGTSLADATLMSDFGELPLFREFCADKLMAGTMKAGSRAEFDKFFAEQRGLFGPTGQDGKPNPLYPVPDHLSAIQESSEKQMKAADGFITNCCCCCMPLGATGRSVEINANHYVKDGTSALRAGYKYSNTSLQLFVNAPKKMPSRGTLLPCVLFVRGGGIVTSAASWQFCARKLASTLDAVVVNIDTRLPRFATGPGAMLDAYAALNWTLEQVGEDAAIPEFRFVNSSRVSLMVNSGGAIPGIALALELAKRQESHKLKCVFPQVPLIFPRTMFPDPSSAGTAPFVRRCHEEVCEAQWRCFASPEDSLEQNLAGVSPESVWTERDTWPELFTLGEAARTLLPEAPPFCILTAEFCFLRPQTDEFALAAKEGGKLLDYVVLPGRAHREVNTFDAQCIEISRRMLDLYG